jgi:hypothetical protein
MNTAFELLDAVWSSLDTSPAAITTQIGIRVAS